jgi:hypothetical protein
MDPNELLKDLIKQAKFVLKNENTHDDQIIAMAERVVNLDNWLKNGGFIPDRWITRK